MDHQEKMCGEEGGLDRQLCLLSRHKAIPLPKRIGRSVIGSSPKTAEQMCLSLEKRKVVVFSSNQDSKQQAKVYSETVKGLLVEEALVSSLAPMCSLKI